MLGIHQTIGSVSLSLGILGIIAASLFRRPLQFRIKLGVVFAFPLLTGLGSMVYPENEFHIIQHTMNTAFMILISILYWRESKNYFSSEGYHRQSLSDYMDNIPDLIWIQDMDYRYTYVNQAVLDVFGITACDIIGKVQNDIQSSYPRISLESHDIAGKLISLQVYKGPIYSEAIDSTKKLVGYISVGRDLSYDVDDHNRISKLISENNTHEALKVFEMHKNRYTNEDVSRETGINDISFTDCLQARN